MKNSINIGAFMELRRGDNEEYIRELLELNDSAEHGLTLTAVEINELLKTRAEALSDNSRVEVGIHVVKSLIKSFSSSLFLTQENYAATLNELVKIFYYMKTESNDGVSDNKLLEIMKKQFENRYHGSTELMKGREFRYDKGYDEYPDGYKISGDYPLEMQIVESIRSDNLRTDDDNDYIWQTEK